MDLELLVWVTVFVGGYSAVLSYFLWVAIRKKEEGTDGE